MPAALGLCADRPLAAGDLWRGSEKLCGSVYPRAQRQRDQAAHVPRVREGRAEDRGRLLPEAAGAAADLPAVRSFRQYPW